MKFLNGPGIINASAIYTKEEFKRRLRIEEGAYRKLRRNGLPTRKIGRIVVISGSEFANWLSAKPTSD